MLSGTGLGRWRCHKFSLSSSHHYRYLSLHLLIVKECCRGRMDGSTTKRARSHSSSDEQGSNHLDQSHAAKVARAPTTTTTVSHELVCTLPPTCSPPNPASRLSNSADLEKHYALYHAHVCEVKRCNCVFPEARFLDLHLKECHDPLSEVRKERGERTFECFQPRTMCSRSFLTPKSRRRHLIEAHGYPKEFFFSVTNKGIGGLLRKWGDGASLLRGTWTARGDMELGNSSEEAHESHDGSTHPVAIAPSSLSAFSGTSDNPNRSNSGTNTVPGADDDVMAEIASAVQSLALVPNGIRFGRGGNPRGFTRPPKKHLMPGPTHKDTNDTQRHGLSVRDNLPPLTRRGIHGDNSVREGTDPNVDERHPNHTHRVPVDNSNGRPGANFVAVNSRGRGRGKLWVPPNV